MASPSSSVAAPAADPVIAAPTPKREGGTGTLGATSTPSPSKSVGNDPAAHPFMEGLYSGSWACGRPEGRGTYTSHLGSAFDGVWRRGWADGAGVYHWADGRADVGLFIGEADRLPLLAAVGEGVRWSRDRSKAALLRHGVEAEAISTQRAQEIAMALGVSPAVPAARSPAAHRPARVSKRELDSFGAFLSKRQRTALDSRLSSGTDDADAPSFETVWAALAP